MLEAIQALAQFEKVSIAALALQAISNLSNCKQVAQVSTLIANESFTGQFGYVAKKYLGLNQSLFLLDIFEIGKRNIPSYANVNFSQYTISCLSEL